MTSSPKAIFFDMDGTILDWTTGMEESWLESCERHHDPAWPHRPPQIHEAIRARRLWFWNDVERATRGRMDLDGASREIVRNAFDDLGIGKPDLAHQLADFYRALRFTRIFPYPGAIETLQAFRSRGVRMALLTNGEARNQRRAVERHGLDRYFDCIVIEGEFGCGKPDERVFRHALDTVGEMMTRAPADPCNFWCLSWRGKVRKPPPGGAAWFPESELDGICFRHSPEAAGFSQTQPRRNRSHERWANSFDLGGTCALGRRQAPVASSRRSRCERRQPAGAPIGQPHRHGLALFPAAKTHIAGIRQA